MLRDTLATLGIITSGLLDGAPGAVRMGTLHSAKGLEFRAVVIVGCEDETLPNRYAVMGHIDPLDQELVLEQEQHLLYVGMTRAREELIVSWVGAPSRWLPPPA
jgi:superfamily I DNA/RNA helicase